MPTRGKRGGEVRIKAKTRRSTQSARYGELTAIGGWSGWKRFRRLLCQTLY